jgi:hypothetical protein
MMCIFIVNRYKTLWDQVVEFPNPVTSPYIFENHLLKLIVHAILPPCSFINIPNLIPSDQPGPQLMYSAYNNKYELTIKGIIGRHWYSQPSKRALQTAHAPLGSLSTRYQLLVEPE